MTSPVLGARTRRYPWPTSARQTCHKYQLAVRCTGLLPSSCLDRSHGEDVRMEDSAFDRFARTVGTGGSRRRLLGLLTGLSLGSALTVLATHEATAEKPKDRLSRRTRQHRRKRRNEKRRNQKQGGGNGGRGGLTGTACIPAGQDGCIDQADCCAGATCRRDGVCRAGTCGEGGAPFPHGSADCCPDAVCTEAGTCCGAQGGACTANADCCDGGVCNGANTCQTTCIDKALEGCNSDADCCLGRTCEKNFQGFPPLACTHKNGEACAPPPEGIDPKAWTGFCPAGSGCSQQHKCAMCGVDEFPCSTSDDCCFAYTCAAGRCR